MKQDTHREQVIFIAMAFLLPLFPLALIAAGAEGFVRLILFGLQAATPTLAAVLTVTLFGGRQELGRFLKIAFTGQTGHIARMAAGTLGLFAVLTIGATVLWFVMGANADIKNMDLSQLAPSPERFLVIGWALFAEETGWRGYMHQRIRITHNLLTPLLIGLVWTAWHYHFYLGGSLQNPLLPFISGCVGESYILYYVTCRTGGNIIPASLWHLAGNLTLSIIKHPALTSSHAPDLYTLYTLVMCCGGIGALLATRRMHLPTKRIER